MTRRSARARGTRLPMHSRPSPKDVDTDDRFSRMASSHCSGRYCPSCGSRLARDNTDALCALCRKKAQDAIRHPPTVPSEFWHAHHLKEAFATWHIGNVIRSYRHHPFHGPRPLAQELVGRWLGLTQAQVSRIEQGQQIKDLDRLIRWAQILHIPGEYLWFKLPGQQCTDKPEAALASPNSDVVAGSESATSVEKDSEDMNRTEFLLWGGTALTGLLASPLVHDWHEPQHEPALPDLTDVLLHQVRAQTEGFQWLSRKEGASKHLPATARHARNLTRFWRCTDEGHALRPQLAEVAADACRLVAGQAIDQGKRVQAIEWYGCSADLAARANSRDLYVLGVCGGADIHAKSGDVELALSMLDQLPSLGLSAAARCYMAVYEALVYASAQHRDPALRALDTAMAYAERTTHEAPSSWFGISDREFVERYRAFILARFGEAEALSVLARLDQSTPTVFRRYRVTLAIDRAETYAHRQELEPTADSLTSALLLNQHVHSVVKAKRILRVRAMLDPYQDTQAIKAVDEVIHATKVRHLISRG